MKWFRRRRAEGGRVPRERDAGVPILLSRGVSVVPDSANVDLIRRLAPDADIYTVSEWMAAEGQE